MKMTKELEARLKLIILVELLVSMGIYSRT